MKVLVTGGAGYIGSHTCVELITAGYDAVIIDNFSNSKRSVLDRLQRITGQRIDLIEGDVRDLHLLGLTFTRHKISAVLHFAGLKAVAESVERPLDYYDVNVYGSIQLARSMAAHAIKTIVFSSSATVYGDPHEVPIREDFPLRPASPYGRSKMMVEEVLCDLAISDPSWRTALLRYFNPVGAHESGLIGEDPHGPPNNLVPYVCQVAVGRLDSLPIFGNDYPTGDGTGVRDYIHVLDLAKGHVAALRYLESKAGVVTVNLGTGHGSSVLDVVKAFEQASGRSVPYRFAPRRPGDIASYYADASLAAEILGWRAERDLGAMCEDAWRWAEKQVRGEG